MGGYQLMVSADIFRGRYRESFETPKAIAADKALLYRFALPTANHVFLPGHRIMVQVQSSWFPLYDRNPQTFVPSIFWAKPENYRKATQRVFHAPAQESFIELPLVGTPSGNSDQVNDEKRKPQRSQRTRRWHRDLIRVSLGLFHRSCSFRAACLIHQCSEPEDTA
jgi:hypothetical protein